LQFANSLLHAKNSMETMGTKYLPRFMYVSIMIEASIIIE